MSKQIKTNKKMYLLILISLSLISCMKSPNNNIEPTESVQVPTFNYIYTNIIAPKCMQCHSTGAKYNNQINLSSYASIMSENNIFPLVVKGEAKASALYNSIKYGEMPQGKLPLTEDEVELVFIWINSGALPGDELGEISKGSDERSEQEDNDHNVSEIN